MLYPYAFVMHKRAMSCPLLEYKFPIRLFFSSEHWELKEYNMFRLELTMLTVPFENPIKISFPVSFNMLPMLIVFIADENVLVIIA